LGYISSYYGREAKSYDVLIVGPDIRESVAYKLAGMGYMSGLSRKKETLTALSAAPVW